MLDHIVITICSRLPTNMCVYVYETFNLVYIFKSLLDFMFLSLRIVFIHQSNILFKKQIIVLLKFVHFVYYFHLPFLNIHYFLIKNRFIQYWKELINIFNQLFIQNWFLFWRINLIAFLFTFNHYELLKHFVSYI